MSFNLPASSCPPLQSNSAIQYLATAFNPIGPGSPGSPFLSGGITSKASSTSSSFNELSLYAYLVATYGGGNFGVLNGLQLSTATGLTLPVSAGQALVGGIAEKSNGGTVVVPDNTARVWIYIQAGVDDAGGSALIQAVATSLTPPAGQWTLIGNCTTSGGNITAVDYSNVAYLTGGQAMRTTADTGAPADTPASNVRVQSVTQGGTYFWDGTAHRQLVDDGVLSMSPSGVQLGGQTSYSFNQQALTATLALTNASPNIQRLTAASGQVVTLPANATINFGSWFQIYNDNASGASITLKDSTGATTIATIAPGNFVSTAVNSSGGSPVWPTSLTPGPIP